jgi:hypothetical protein
MHSAVAAVLLLLLQELRQVLGRPLTTSLVTKKSYIFRHWHWQVSILPNNVCMPCTHLEVMLLHIQQQSATAQLL